MSLQLKINFFISAALSMSTVLLLYGDELGRRLGNYFPSYLVIWVLSVVGLLLLSFRLIGSPTALKTIILGVSIGYLSVVLAHVFAVVLDVTNIRIVHKPLSGNEFVIPLVFPFFVLKGWMFSVLFIPLAFLLNQNRGGR